MSGNGATAADVRHDISILTDDDLHLFNEGNHFRLYEKCGAHPVERDGVRGAHFAVWAPDAERVSVKGEFNDWNPSRHWLRSRGQSGLWEGFIPGVDVGALYKFHIESRHNGYQVEKSDPFAVYAEIAPKTASIVWDLNYQWNDSEWMQIRKKANAHGAPMSIYEVHLGSWRRKIEDNNRSLSYRELAVELVSYVKEMGFTHVEFLPVMEHPFFGSWGYQITGFFAPTSRFGTPQDFMWLIDHFHQNNIGVILDWVPSHFPTDQHGLGYFDGSSLYEHVDPRQGFHPDWGSLIFNYGRNEVRSFLISSALYWLDKFHIDGLRVDAVASMLYLDYSRPEGAWVSNPHGGRDNLEAISFLRRFNEEVYRNYPDVQTFAEESTAWPMVSRPTTEGGLGFGFKWDMGWMHDTLDYMGRDPVHRKFHHNQLTFRMLYAFKENFVLSISHDEVVHGKSSLLTKMPGDNWQKMANVRLLLADQFGQPGKKLMFMGGEFGQWQEWNHDTSLDWHLLQFDPHRQLQQWVRDLNAFYRSEPALHEREHDWEGFEWIDCDDADNSVVSFLRKSPSTGDLILVVLNTTPVPRAPYRVGVPRGGHWQEALNSDALTYGGSGVGNFGGLQAEDVPWHGRGHSLNLTLPPLGALFFKQGGNIG